MRPRRTWLTLLGIAVGSALGLASGVLAADGPALLAGAAKTSLAPGAARALVFRQGETGVALVALEGPAVSGRLSEEVRRRVPDLDLDAVVLLATGSGESPRGLLEAPFLREEGGPFDAGAAERAAERIAEVLRRAAQAAGPVRAARGSDPDADVLLLTAADGTRIAALVRVAEGRAGPVAAAAIEGALGAVALVATRPPADLRDVPWQAPPGEVAEGIAALARGLDDGEARTLAVAALEARAPTAFGALLGRGEGSGLPGADPVPLRMTRVGLGDLDLLAAPGRFSASLARRMGDGEARWVLPRAGDHAGDFPDRDEFRALGAFAADARVFFGPDAADLLVAAARGEAARGAPLPAPSPAGAPLRIAGATPRELGGDHGRRLRVEIRDLLGAAERSFAGEMLRRGAGLLLLPQVKATGLPARDLLVPALVLAARRLQAHVPEDLLDEMEGVAEGAGVPYDAILLENTFLTLAEQTDPAALLVGPARCTNVVALGEATSMGQVLHGSTLDWGMREVLQERAICLVVEPPEGHPFASVTWPGMVGTLRAMGAQGVAVTEESCAASDDTGMDGMPVNLLMRRVVQRSANLEEAVATLRGTPGTCGYKVTVSDGVRLDARVVEVTARRGHVRRPDRGLLFGCDPDAGPECFDGECDPRIPRNDDSSARRYPVLRRLLEGIRGRVRGPLLAQALATSEGGILQEDTLLACLFEPSAGRFHVALGADVDAASGTLAWRTFDLPDLLSPERRAAYRFPWTVTAVGDAEVSERKVPLGSTRVLDVTLASPLSTGDATLDRIAGQLFEPEGAQGVVILMPPWKSNTLAGERLIAVNLASQGIACFVLPLPGQAGRAPKGSRSGEWTLSENLARSRRSMLQGAADAARVSLWLESRGFRPERQGVMGVSLGGHVAAIACGAYPDRFSCGAFLLAGAGMERAVLQPNGTTDGIRRRLVARGVTLEEARGLIGDVDPGPYGRPDHRERVLLVGGRTDPVVPPECVEDLARAWGGARIEWYDGDHYGVLMHLGDVLRAVTAHFHGVFDGR